MGELISAWGVILVLVSGLVFPIIGKFAWVYQAVAFLASSVSASFSAGVVDACM